MKNVSVRKIKNSRILKRQTIKEKIISHIESNIKEYFLIFLLFIIGIIVGVIVINNYGNAEETTNYINDMINQLKNNGKIDKSILLKETLISNISLVIFLWFVGSTVIGIPIAYGTIAFRGFSFGYTIGSIILVIGMQKGILFIFAATFLQNLIFIPSIIMIGVSCMKVYKSITRDKRRQNIKIELVKHTFLSLIITGLLTISAFVETYISSNLVEFIIRYI